MTPLEIENAALVSIGCAPLAKLPGLDLAFVPPLSGELIWGRRRQTVLVNPMQKQVVVMQHIRLATGRVISAPYLMARGVG